MTADGNKYSAMSQDFIARAQDYLERGDLVQASEKSWGAAACALKAIAERRGWNHRSHSLLFDISNQVADELGRSDLLDMFLAARSMHQNFYENWEPEEGVVYAIGRVREYLAELEAVSPELPVSFVAETRSRRRRLERLTGQAPPL